MPLVSGFKQIPDFTKIQRPVLELLIEDNKKPNIFKTFGYVALNFHGMVCSIKLSVTGDTQCLIFFN